MRVLLVNDISLKYQKSTISGGIEKAVFDQAKLIKEYNDKPIIMVTSDSDVPDYYESIVSDICSKETWKQTNGNKQQFVATRFYETLVKHKDEFDALILNSGITSMIKGLKKFLSEYPKPSIAIVHNTANYGMLSLTFNQELKDLIDNTCAITASVSKFAKNDNNSVVPGCIDDVCVLQYTDIKDDVLPADNYNMIFQRVDSAKNLPLALLSAGKSGIKTYFFTNKRKYTSADDDLYDEIDEILKKYSNIEVRYDRPHSEIMEYLRKARCQIFTGLKDSASITTFESASRGIPTVIQYKNKTDILEDRLAPYMFLSVSEYFSDAYTYRKNNTTVSDILAEKIKNLDTSYELRKQSAEKVRSHFTKDSVYNNIMRLINLSKEKING